MSSVKFSNSNPVFFNTLRQRVNQYFQHNQLKPTGNFKLYFKTILLLLGLAGCYIFLVFFTPASVWVSLLVCVVMGLLMAGIGFNVFHDGAHGSFSSQKWVNDLMSYTLNMMGGSSFIWKQKHNINHHSYTNIEGMDDDIDIRPFIRVNESQKKYWFHRFQHVYSLLFYGFTYLFWIFYNDFKKYFSGKISDHTPLRKMSVSEHIMFWVTKLAYVAVFLFLPAWNVGILPTLAGYGVIVFICGFVIALVFQLAHIHGDVEFVAPEASGFIVENEWAIHQINTTQNFATRSRWIGWFWGGLNFQIEHHLFPKISHIHYPAISQIVKQTCIEFNVMYREYPTVLCAVRSHLSHLRESGIR